MKKDHFVIAIERQYGSGGRIVGKMLAQELGIHFYDEEILTITSETSAIGEQYFRLADEKAGNNLLYRVVKEMKPDLYRPAKGDKLTTPENLFRFQSDVIRKIAAEETCIFAGRCANYVLEEENMDELIRIFVYANMDTRVRRVMDVDKVDEKEALKRIKRIDKERHEYHNYFAGRDWMDMEHYDLPINSSRLEFEEMVVLIKDYIALKGFSF